jgi:N-acetylglucosamine kinase-like BadF-type ATPase
MRSGELLLGVDGGGTKTHAVLADLSLRVLAHGFGPASNHRRVGFAQACAAIAAAIEAALGALRNTSLPPGADEPRDEGRIVAACLGLAGVDGPEDQALVATWLQERNLAPRLRVVNDTELTLAAGTPDGWGVALISGTGSNCLARSPEGKTLRVGGWGPRLGDEGSGYQIGMRALQAAAQAADGRGAAEALLRVVLEHWDLADLQDLLPYAYDSERTQADIASLAMPVVALAGHGDREASQIVQEAARELASHVNAAVRRLELEAPPLALTGGTLQSAFFREAVVAAITVPIGPVAFVAEPSLGALSLARHLLAGVEAERSRAKTGIV